MNLKDYKLKRRNKLKKKALVLLKQGFSLREVGKTIGRSHENVRKFWLEQELAKASRK